MSDTLTFWLFILPFSALIWVAVALAAAIAIKIFLK